MAARRRRRKAIIPVMVGKSCSFTKAGVSDIDYKDLDTLKSYVGETGKITSHFFTGTRNYYQRKLAKAIKRARYMALLPYTDQHKIN